MGVKRGFDGPSVVEHYELVAELPTVEKMTTAERLKHAKKRRAQQLKKYNMYDKQWEKELQKSKKKPEKRPEKKPKPSRNIKFATNVMLLEAAARNDITEVTRLLDVGVSADVTNEDGLTALHQCCIDDLEDMMALLLEHGADVNARDTELWTPLHAAATCGHVHLCQYLIDHGAELLSVNADGNMPYDICEDEVTLDYIESEMAKRDVTQEQIDETRLSTENNMLEDLKWLANNGKDLEYRGRSGESPLHIAAANGYILVVEFLLEHRVRVDLVDDDSWQPVHCAACWGHLPVLELLAQHGADLEAKTKTGETPLDICEDLDLKDRLIELKDELESSRGDRTQSLSRRRSVNTRSSVISNSSNTVPMYSSNTSLHDKNPLSQDTSDLARNHLHSSLTSASVRRTSMREKSKISWKDAHEEAQRLRESTEIEDEEEDENATDVAQMKTEVSQLQKDMEELINRDEEEDTLKGATASFSSAKADDVHLQISGSLFQTEEESYMEEEKRQQQQQPSAVALSQSAVKYTPPPSESKQKAATQDKPSPKTVKKETHKSSPKPAKASTSKQQKQDHKKQTSEASRQQAQNSANNPVAPPRHSASSVPRPPPSTAPSSDIAPPADKKNRAPAPPTTSSTTQAMAGRNSVQPPHGTLADLKKQRAKRLANTLKSKDMQLENSSGQNHYLPLEENEVSMSPTTPAQQNGHKKDVQSSRNSYGGSERRRKFSSTSEVVGDPHSDSSCCVIL